MSNQAATDRPVGLAMAQMRISLLGSPVVEWAGRPLLIPRRRVRALLYRMAIQLRPIPREQLCFLLWPDSPEASARRGLSHLLTHLRRALPTADLLITSGDAIGLNPEHTWSDAAAFEQLCAVQASDERIAALEQAVDLYRGPLLAGSSLPDNPEFESWVTLERHRAERLYLNALETLIEQHIAGGDYSSAIAYAERYLATDELAEAMYRRLILLYALMGDRNAALRQFERCLLILERELNVSPLPETRAAYQAVLEGRAIDPRQLMTEGRGPKTEEQTPLSSVLRPRSNLPAQLTSFIGREREIVEVKRLLTATRLLTLTGAGGSGKTRLALEAAKDLVGTYADGVWWVELASLSDPALVPEAVAMALDVREQPGRAIIETLKDTLRSRNLVLLLDNCEHLVAAAARLAYTLLRACPQLRILTTSREALGIDGETTWRVPTLSLPEWMADSERQTADGDPSSAVRRLLSSEAVRLFIERAQAAWPEFMLTEQNVATVAQICRRLDGMPLAIELAAARMKALTVEQIAARLDDAFRLLTGGSRIALPRHQTLRAAMDWSYELLSEQEQALLRRLAVFAGGWTLEAAETVCAFGDGGRKPWSSVPRPEVLDLLSHLVDKSLVVMYVQGAEGRYRLLETVRQYAWEKLLESGEAGILQRRHAQFFLALAEEAEPELRGARQMLWLDRLEVEHDNLRAVLAWSQAHKDVESGQRLAGALWRFWAVRGHWSEGRRWLEGLPSADDEGQRTEDSLVPSSVPAPRSFRAKALFVAGVLAWLQSDYAAARSWHEESLARWREVIGAAGPFGGSQATSAAEVSARRGLAYTLTYLGLAQMRQGDYASAGSLCEESLALFRALGDKWGLATTLNYLGGMALNQGDHAAARSRLEEALALGRELGDRTLVAVSLNSLGELARDQGDDARAAARYEESLALRRELGDKGDIASPLHNLGYVALRQGDQTRAAALFRESLILTREAANDEGIALCLMGLASVSAAMRQLERAARLFGAAERLFEARGAVLNRPDRAEYERNVAAVRSALSTARFAQAWAEGRAMTVEQAVAYALALPTSAAERLPAYAVKTAYNPAGLTVREIEVLGLVAQGLSDAQVAEKLVISPRTVTTHLTSIYRKLGTASRAEAVRRAAEYGLV